MVRMIRTVKAIEPKESDKKILTMIKDLENMNLKAHVKDDDFESLLNHIIEINGRIHNIV